MVEHSHIVGRGFLSKSNRLAGRIVAKQGIAAVEQAKVVVGRQDKSFLVAVHPESFIAEMLVAFYFKAQRFAMPRFIQLLGRNGYRGAFGFWHGYHGLIVVVSP